MIKLTTTMQPGREYEVTEQEALDLVRRGVVKTLDGKPVHNPEKVADQLDASGEEKPK